MNTRKLCIGIIALLSAISPCAIQGMHITKKFPQAFYKQQALRYCNQVAQKNNSVLKEGSIVEYKPERDEKIVSTLVWKNLRQLTSDVTEANQQEKLDKIIAKSTAVQLPPKCIFTMTNLLVLSIMLYINHDIDNTFHLL